MPHQCIHCSAIYDDGSREMLQGCACGSKFFFYLTAEKLRKIKQVKPEVVLTGDEKERIESDVREIIGIEKEDAPVVLDFESVRLLKPGKYLIDIHNLFAKGKPLVYSLEDGKYFIDLNSKLSKKREI